MAEFSENKDKDVAIPETRRASIYSYKPRPTKRRKRGSLGLFPFLVGKMWKRAIVAEKGACPFEPVFVGPSGPADVDLL